MPPCVCSPNVYVFSHRPVIYIQNHDNNFFQCSGNQTLLFPWCISHKNVGYIKLTSLLLQLSQFILPTNDSHLFPLCAARDVGREETPVYVSYRFEKEKKTVRGGY